jgi:hypothetical protein
MKFFKIIIFLLFLINCFSFIFSQSLSTVPVSDDIYEILYSAQQRGLCSSLPLTKPYTQNLILQKLSEIEEQQENLTEKELEIIQYQKNRFIRKNGFNIKHLSYRTEKSDNNQKINFEINNTDEVFVSAGFYDKKENSAGFDFFNTLTFTGDLGNHASYSSCTYIGFTKMKLQELGDYHIGYWWKDTGYLDSANTEKVSRTIKKYVNNSVLPYSYKKKWDGSVYYLTNLSYSGLEGWPFDLSLAFGMTGEIRTSFLNEHIQIGFSRTDREYAAMDNGSSLVLNSNASPFIGIDATFKVLDWFSLSTLTGVLEFPNQTYSLGNAWYRHNETYDSETSTYTLNRLGGSKDSYFFQNAYSIGLLDFNWKYFHFDFGSSCIWPKRFELGYMFPLIDRVVYQNSVGDYDNLSLFADFKTNIPYYGSLWASLYLEELSSLIKSEFWKKTRCMYAYQFGTKANIPVLPFTTISCRYTKIEPYCYTHEALIYQPWYSDYISEAYINNGRPLGYYLEPNSDELLIKFETRPLVNLKSCLQYQMIRHGADYGSGQVAGNSIYSELPTGNRNIYYKYFLHDGTYQWTHIISLNASYDLKYFNIPLTINTTFGFIHDSFTQSELGANQKSAYHKINTTEYPVTNGFVFSISVKAFTY